MSSRWRPLVVGAVVTVAVFLLALARIFEPSVGAGAGATGNPKQGEIVFERACASCHGLGGGGGSVGPRLVETGLDAAEVSAAVEQGRGVMPAGIVTGQEQADVVAYVVSVSSPVK